ncbi:geraniol 8-hydroxylase-like [Solanum pennellii]|uniref:Geraniol 8-hydroxylase-like n=1 Tax=Solanum pennellii TaxID=28526 RepID=A0ABM1V2R1_SOLPN|nr:geraniol 8-hydroxylase-like [Solanum pennellii]
MDYVVIVGGLLLVRTLFQCIRWVAISKRGNKKLPPGPIPLPLIGNLHNIVGDQPHKSLARLAQIYGLMMSLRMGQSGNIFSSSGKTSLTKTRIGLLQQNNSRCNPTRKILNSNLFSGDKLDATQHLRSQKMQDFIGYCGKCSQTGESVNVGQAAFETMKRIDPQGIRRRIGKHSDKLLQLIGGLIDERLEQRRKSPNDSRTDFLEVMLNTSEEDPQDLFIAGTDTTSSTLEWAMVEVMRIPYITNKAKTDFADVIGKGKIIKEADIVRLPYLQCIVKETLRMHPPVPFLIRKVDQDVEACSYFVLKDSQVLVNVILQQKKDLDVEEKFGITLARLRPLRAVPISL